MATEAQLLRARSSAARREYRVSIGPPRASITEGTFTLGEPVTLPAQTTVTADMLPGETGVSVGDTSGYPTTGTLIVSPNTADVSWWSYTGKTSSTFTGLANLQGAMLMKAGQIVTAWATLGIWPPLPQSGSQRLDRPPQIQEFKDGAFYDFSCEISGVYFDRRLLKDDATVLIEERVSPEGNIDLFTDWMVAAVGYVRRWEVEVDAQRNNRWRGTVRSIRAYLDLTRFPATQYGRVELLAGASVIASDNLANPEDELNEFLGGLGTTGAENAVDDNNNTLYISQLSPTATAETPGDSDGADPGVQIEEVFNGDAQSPNLEWILLRLAADSPNHNETGVNLHNFAITNKQTAFAPSNVGTWPKELGSGGGGGYIRLRNITLTSANDIVVFTNDGAAFRARYNVGSSVQVFDWRYIDGFGDDQEPARLFELDTDDWLQLRYCRGLETVRSMVVWGTHTGTPWWNNTADETESGAEWTPDNAVAWTTADTSIRRNPVSTNTRRATAFSEETDPNPGDRRTDTDQVYWSAAVPEFSVYLASNITNVSPANGAALSLTDATWLDASGTVKLDSEKISYTARNATQLLNITRGAASTTPASHTTAALVYQVDAILGDTRLPVAESLSIRRWLRMAPAGNPLRNIVPERFDLYGSTNATPLYPGEDDWRLDWIQLARVTGNGQIHYETGFSGGAQRLAHILIYCKKMTDNGRFKLNEVKLYRKQLDSAPNAETGAGIVVRDILEIVLAPAEIAIDAGAFVGTNGELTTAEASAGQVLQDILTENFCILRCNRDGTVEVFRDPFHPLGRRVESEGTFTGEYLRSPMSTDYPSRYGADQIIVEIINARTGDVYEGRYPPNANILNVERIVLRRNVASQEAANAAAAAIYLKNPEISRTFRFTTSGAAEWLTVGHRLLLVDYSDDERPIGRVMNTLVIGVEHNRDGAEEVTAREWRAV